MIQPLVISSVISAISVVAAKKFLRREPKMQKVLERRRLDPTYQANSLELVYLLSLSHGFNFQQ